MIKEKNKMAKIKNVENESKTVSPKPFEGDVEYEMSKEMAKQILATRKGTDQNMHPQEFLCKVVNEEFGIKGNCVRVLTS
jgi:signal recognition particle GTPase